MEGEGIHFERFKSSRWPTSGVLLTGIGSMSETFRGSGLLNMSMAHLWSATHVTGTVSETLRGARVQTIAWNSEWEIERVRTLSLSPLLFLSAQLGKRENNPH